MYRLDIYHFPNSIEYEYKFKGNYGAKGEKRAKRQKRTPEDIARQNQYQKTKTVRHLIKANFGQGDYYTTLTYSEENRDGKPIQAIVDDVRRFLSLLRKAYKKTENPCKYIYRIEIGSRGGLHVHLILNRIDNLDRILQESWTLGRVHNELLDNGTYEKLADYMTKPPTDQQKKILRSFADSEDTRKLIRYSRSRNLVKPTPETHIKSNKTMRSVFNHDLTPQKGFYIDKESVRRGVNAFTGMSYLYYQEIRLEKGGTAPPLKLHECPICHQLTFEGLTCGCQKRKKRSVKHIR